MSAKTHNEYEPFAPAEEAGDAPKDAAPQDAASEVFTISRTHLNYAIVAGLFLLLGAIAGALLSRGGGLSDAQVRDIVYEEMRAAGVSVRPRNVNAVNLVDDDPFRGVSDAPITIVEFGDFRCGFCARHRREVLPRILSDYNGYVKYVFRDWPALGQPSVEAAIAGECMHEQGMDRFWQFHDVAYANQQAIGRDFFISTAQQLGVDVPTFTACIDNRTPLAEIQADFDAGRELGVTGTPLFIVNTQYVVGAQAYEVFQRVIDEELAKVGVQRSSGEGMTASG